MTKPGTDRVECYSGHTYAQEPRAVVWQGRRTPVTRIERRWRMPEGLAFLVETETGTRFELRYREVEGIWSIRPLSEVESNALEPEKQDDGSIERENDHPGNNKPPSR